MKSNLFKNLGIGVGLRPPHYDVFLSDRPKSVSWVEVISENFMPWQGKEAARVKRPLETLEKIRAHYPVALHGVSLSIGSTDPLNQDYLKRLKTLVDCVQPALISDHLCWTGVDGQNTHDLLPVPYTREALKLISEKICRVQDLLGRRILLENPSSYAGFSFSEMSEWEFLTELAEQSDCGILLDVNNVYVSSINHGFDAQEYMRGVPPHRIAQIHLAGHSEQGGLLVDTHDSPVCREVWSLYRSTLNLLGDRSTMIERDGNIPSWFELETELGILRRIQNEKVVDSSSSRMAATI